MKKVLIANRTEIACRIHRAAAKQGLLTAGVYSEADEQSLHRRTIPETHLIGPGPASESYLVIEKIIDVAKKSGCDAVHPGYGFLAENADFAAAVTKAGLKFIGPNAETIHSLGNKVEARKIAEKAKVPMLPGTPGGLDNEGIQAAAEKLGFPLIIKAAAGGGGRGMRIANDAKELAELLPLARSEALKFFANEDVYCERYLPSPRHVEVQIMGDGQGNVVHFGTRDCSVQRRHQKLVEEAPAPGLSDACFEGITGASVALGKELNYESAGTVEFLVQGDDFFFLEVNTRIQVEHPVTELITGEDLVGWQLRVAQGESLAGVQEKVEIKGHAIEFRLVAEDPRADFAPQSGAIDNIQFSELFTRVDAGYQRGDSVGLFYDSLVAKLMIYGETRGEALEKGLLCLRDSSVRGIATNLDFHKWLLLQPEFLNAELSIRYLGDHFAEGWEKQVEASEVISEQYRRPVAGSFPVERYSIEVAGKPLELEVLHREAAVFEARPRRETGEYFPKETWRRSNCLATLLETYQSTGLLEPMI